MAAIVLSAAQDDAPTISIENERDLALRTNDRSGKIILQSGEDEVDVSDLMQEIRDLKDKLSKCVTLEDFNNGINQAKEYTDNSTADAIKEAADETQRLSGQLGSRISTLEENATLLSDGLDDISDDLRNNQIAIDRLNDITDLLVDEVANISGCHEKGTIHVDGECVTAVTKCLEAVTSPSNGNVRMPGSDSDVFAGQSIAYTCNDGYYLDGDSDVITCQASGKYDAELPTCKSCGTGCKHCSVIDSALKCTECSDPAEHVNKDNKCTKPNGIIVVGGLGNGGPAYDIQTGVTWESYNVNDNSFTLYSSSSEVFPVARRAVVLVQVGGLPYSLGGISNTHQLLNDFYVLDENDQGGFYWKSLGTMPYPVAWASGNAYKGNIYFFGGRVSNGVSNRAFEYNVDQNKFTELAKMSTGTFGHCSAVAGDKVYVVGGVGGQGRTDRVEVFDLKTKKWDTSVSITAPYGTVNYFGLVATSAKLYMFGGVVQGVQGTSDLYSYDISSKQWTSLTSMPQGRAEFGYSLLNNKIYVFGAYYPGNLGSETLEYDISGDSWTTKANMNRLRGVNTAIPYDLN